jgi:PPE-repeat protein
VFDFVARPPEVNSWMIYTGPGPAPLLATAAAWEVLAGDLRLAATGHGLAVADLVGTGWQGSSSAAMAAAAARYVGWMHATAAQAEQAGMQAAAAVSAYEAAFAATVPPPVIAANRTRLMWLVAHNALALGTLTPAIMATEAEYMEFWAQDATAICAYASASEAASMLTPMAAAPPTTNSGGLAGSAVAAGWAGVNNMQGAVQGLGTQAANSLPGSASTLLDGFGSGISEFGGLLSSTGGQGSEMGTSGLSGLEQPAALGLAAAVRTPEALPQRLTPAMPEAAVAPARLMPSAALGQATSVGGLSVPRSWAPAAVQAAGTPDAATTGAAPAAAPMLPRGLSGAQLERMEPHAPGMPRVVVLQRSLVG